MGSSVNNFPIDEDVELEQIETDTETTFCCSDTIFTYEGEERARCKRCKKDYAVGSSSNKKFDQNIYREKFAMANLAHSYPFEIVEDEGMRDLISYLNSAVEEYTRDMAKADCIKIYEREKELLRDVLASIPGRISLTFDLYTSVTKEGYICLTANYVDSNWVLRSKILNFCHFPPTHDASLLSENVYGLLAEWGIEKKVFSLTSDNTMGVLKSQLRNNLLCEGEFFHVRCSADILNRIAKEALEVVNDALTKVRESVKYVNCTEARKVRFVKCCDQLGVNEIYLRQDVPAMWNTGYLMLACALKFRSAFAHFATIESDYDCCPMPQEWDRASEICCFLEAFYKLTTLFLGVDYPTANLYFEIVWVIQVRLLKALESEDDVVREMARKMLPKFEEYWDSYGLILSMTVVLDPRYKMQFVKYCYSMIDEVTLREKMSKVKVTMERLFNVYVSERSTRDSQQTSSFTGDVIGLSFSVETLGFDNYEAFDNTKSELDRYLEEPMFPRREHPEMDVLKFWKDNSGRYPVLSMMARDIMSVPITAVASESAFSSGGKMLIELRNRVTRANAQVYVCGRNWINGYAENGDGLTEDDLLVPLLTSTSM